MILSLCGPYSKLGTPLFSACAHAGTDYVDVNGETWWMRDMIDQFHDMAKTKGAIMVPACGAGKGRQHS